jgi:hypothetical protein
LDFITVYLLDELNLNDSSVERIEVSENRFDVHLGEELTSLVDNIGEVLEESLSSAEATVLLLALSLVSSVDEEGFIETELSNMISESLNALLWPSLDSSHKLSLVFVVEFLDASLEFNLSCSQRMNLIELLEVEEGLGDGELVTAS